MSQKSQELKSQGLDIINLSVGEPDFFTPDHIKEAAKKAVDDNFSFYTPVPGYMSLREAISRKLKSENGVDFPPAQIVVGNGAKQEICNVILSIVDKGDEVIIPTPAWVSYFEMVKLAEGVNVPFLCGQEQDFKILPHQLESLITPRTKAFLFCSPSNPTGAIYTKEELASIVEVLAKYPKIIVIADEIYEHICYSGQPTSIASFPEMKDRVVIINGVSKAYAMTGWRIGFCAAPAYIAKAEMRQEFERRRDLICSAVQDIPGFRLDKKPSGAFYIFPDVSALFGKQTPDGKVIANADDVAMYLLETGHVAGVSGEAFGDPSCIRFSYATSQAKISEAMRRVKEAVAKLRP